jgi:hypothetical protein
LIERPFALVLICNVCDGERRRGWAGSRHEKRDATACYAFAW